MSIVIHSALAEVNCERWNALLDDDYPFLKHQFLLGLEKTGCTTAENGWTPTHFVEYAADQETIVAALPCYEKTHSYGEYIFDWAWADAYYRHGVDYYPKLSSSVPFTPASGQRFLVNQSEELAKSSPDHYANHVAKLVKQAQDYCTDNGLSGWHGLFINEQEAAHFENDPNVFVRHSNQFHWQNQGYSSFDDFLNRLNAKKRKNIKRERRRITEQEITYRWISGDELTPEVMQTMYGFYARTIQMYGAQAYLNRGFFDYLAEHFSDNTMVLLASFGDQTIAGGLYFKSDNTLYGRYWGALHNFHSVHFETCYYQAIEWCIEHGYSRFEAGAQGEHKHARGLSPSRTYFAHWLQEPQFHAAIGQFIEQEQAHIESYQKDISRHSPYRNEL